MRRLIHELRRRDVLRMAAFYVIAAWVVVQVAALLFAGWEVPESSIRYVWLAAFACFPVALIFSWRYDLSSRGISRTPNRDEAAADLTLKAKDHAVVAGLAACMLVVLGTATVSVIGSINGSHSRAAAIAPEKSIAVLAFDDLSPGGDHEWLSNGVTEEILYSLARLPELQVTARTSSFFFKDRNVPVPEIASVLGVRYVVEGSIRRIADDLRVSYRVVRAEDGFPVYEDQIDGGVGDLFALQENIAEHVAEALDVVLDEEKRDQMFSLGTKDIDAYQAYLRGTDLSYRWTTTGNVEDLVDGTKWYDMAIDADPRFSFAYIARANNYQRFLEGLYDPSEFDSEFTAQTISGQMQADFAAASEYAGDEVVRAISDVFVIWLSRNYRGLPGLADRFDPLAASSIPDKLELFPALSLIAIAGHADKVRAYAENRILRDPLDHLGYNHAYVAAQLTGDSEAALAYLQTAQDKIGPSVFTEHNLLVHHVVTGQVDRALELSGLEGTGIEAFRLSLRACLLYATGRTSEADVLMQSIEARGLISPYYPMALRMAGRNREARSLIAAIDAAPGGNLAGTFMMVELAGKLPVPPGWMPVFSARLDEAGISTTEFKLRAASN